MSRKKIPLVQRLKKFVVPSETGCWEWNGTREEKGYGRTKINGKQVSVHRAAYEFFIGPIPDGLHCLHKCDNPSCCNPDHLFLGTNRDNINDMLAKGRQHSKLTRDDAIAIKQIYKRGGTTKKELGAMFGVSFHTVKDVLDGTTWKHVTEGDNDGC